MNVGELDASPSQRRNMWLVTLGGGLLGGMIMATAVYFAWDLRSVELDESQAPVKNLGEIVTLLAKLASPLLAFFVGAGVVNSYHTRLTEQHNMHILSLDEGKFSTVSSIVTALTCAGLLGVAFALDFI
ncbi:MAG TPA: hypothetical protein PKH39_09990 [Woeseiaceae bacterium]|nr:hypothetical protein [Woeseiaceae bacterium]